MRQSWSQLGNSRLPSHWPWVLRSCRCFDNICRQECCPLCWWCLRSLLCLLFLCTLMLCPWLRICCGRLFWWIYSVVLLLTRLLRLSCWSSPATALRSLLMSLPPCLLLGGYLWILFGLLCCSLSVNLCIFLGFLFANMFRTFSCLLNYLCLYHCCLLVFIFSISFLPFIYHSIHNFLHFSNRFIHCYLH